MSLCEVLLSAFSCFILARAWGTGHHCPHFTDEQTEAEAENSSKVSTGEWQSWESNPHLKHYSAQPSLTLYRWRDWKGERSTQPPPLIVGRFKALCPRRGEGVGRDFGSDKPGVETQLDDLFSACLWANVSALKPLFPHLQGEHNTHYLARSGGLNLTTLTNCLVQQKCPPRGRPVPDF